MSPEAKADAARSPTFADGMSNGQARMSGTKHQPMNVPTLPRMPERRSGATTAHAIRNDDRQEEPTHVCHLHQLRRHLAKLGFVSAANLPLLLGSDGHVLAVPALATTVPLNMPRPGWQVNSEIGR